MVSFSFSPSFVTLLASLVLVSATLDGIDPRDVMEETEHVLVDNGGANSNPFIAAVSPCSNYVGIAEGRDARNMQTSAEWVRFVFHDFVTADTKAGTGGVDASLGYEADRPENAGLFVTDTLEFMSPNVNAYMSMSDNIALGVIVSVASCGGTNTDIPMRTGRIDATEAGPSGVPVPTTPLDVMLARFATAGFSQTDTIALTACGHSMGRVHSTGDAPDLAFDTTPAVFDANVVNEYLDGTGEKGGPLVTAPDVAGRTDLRLYTSDDNSTIQAMRAEDAFQAKCNDVFERMINTVPKTVTLSDPIVPSTWKGVDVIMDMDPSGAVTVSGLIRNLYTTETPPDTIAFTTTNGDTKSAEQKSSAPSGIGTSLYGKTTYWPFSSQIESPGTTSVNFGDAEYPINDQIFILPKKASVNKDDSSFNVFAAALTSICNQEGMTATLFVPTTVDGTITKQIMPIAVPMTKGPTVGQYTLFEGSMKTTNAANVVVGVKMGDVSSRTVKSKLFQGGF